MPSKKQPAAKTATTAAAKSATEQQGAAPPPADQQPAEQATASTEDNAAITCDLSDLGRARALPEAPGGPVLFLGVVEFAPGSIEQFADEDGRTMRIVNVDGVLHKFPAEPAPSEPDPAEA
jgi:hypothetical protein